MYSMSCFLMVLSPGPRGTGNIRAAQLLRVEQDGMDGSDLDNEGIGMGRVGYVF